MRYLLHLLRPRTFVAVAVAMLLGGGAFAFTASNTVDATNAGNGSNTISGYTVTKVVYTTSTSALVGGSATNPVITVVAFTLAGANSAPADYVDATLTEASYANPVDYGTCSVVAGAIKPGAPAASGATVTCALTPAHGMAVANAANLTVTAQDNA